MNQNANQAVKDGSQAAAIVLFLLHGVNKNLNCLNLLLKSKTY